MLPIQGHEEVVAPALLPFLSVPTPLAMAREETPLAPVSTQIREHIPLEPKRVEEEMADQKTREVSGPS